MIKQDQLEQAHVQSSFEYFQAGRFSSLPGQPAPGTYHPHQWKNFPRCNSCFFSFFLLLLHASEKSLALSSVWESIPLGSQRQVRSSGSHLFLRLSTPSSCSLSIPAPASGHLGCAPLLLLHCVHVFLVQGGTKLDAALLILSHSCHIEGINLFHWPAGCALAYMAQYMLLMWPNIWMAHFTAGGTLLIHVLFCVHQDAQVCFCKAASQPARSWAVVLCRCVMSWVQGFAFHELVVFVSSSLLFSMTCPDSLPYPLACHQFPSLPGSCLGIWQECILSYQPGHSYPEYYRLWHWPSRTPLVTTWQLDFVLLFSPNLAVQQIFHCSCSPSIQSVSHPFVWKDSVADCGGLCYLPCKQHPLYSIHTESPSSHHWRWKVLRVVRCICDGFPSHLPIPCVLGHGFQEDKIHNLPGKWI